MKVQPIFKSVYVPKKNNKPVKEDIENIQQQFQLVIENDKDNYILKQDDVRIAQALRVLGLKVEIIEEREDG